MTKDRCKELLAKYCKNIKYKQAYSFKPLKREDCPLGLTLHVCGVICLSVAFSETTIMFMQETDFFDYLIRQAVYLLQSVKQTNEDIIQYFSIEEASIV